MKITFFPRHLKTIIFLVLHIVSVFATVFFAVYFFIGKATNYFFASLILFVLSIIAVVCFVLNRLIITDNKIIVTGEKRFGLKDAIVQFKEEIKIDSISNLSLIESALNSKKKNRYSRYYPRTSRSLFLIISLKNNKTKWINLSIYSKRQRAEIVDIINSKTGLSSTYEQMEYRMKEKKQQRDRGQSV